MKVGYEASRRWWHVARDALEFNKNLPRNSPVSTVVHTWAGMGGAAVAINAGGMLRPDYDPDNPESWDRLGFQEKTRQGAEILGWIAVIKTLGSMSVTGGKVHLPRGLNPLYFLGVGAGAWATFAQPKLNENLEY